MSCPLLPPSSVICVNLRNLRTTLPFLAKTFPVSSFLKILAYFLGTLFLGALLAPPLAWAGHALGGAWHPAHWLAETTFQRFFDRAMFLAALLLLPPTVRALHIGGWRDLGLRPDPRAWPHAALGFAAAGGLLWLLGLLLWGMGVYEPRAHAVPWAALIGFLITALVVAAAEEAFFRGALLGLVERTAVPGAALVFVSALFAVLHFLKPPEHAVAVGVVRWWSGFAFLPQTFWQWREPGLVLGGFTTLFAVALVLGFARLRTRALWLPMGLHAGWVFGLKSFSAVSRHPARPNLWIGGDLLHGLGPVLIVLLTGAVIWMWLEQEKRLDPGA